ncbi:MAG: YdeI/OmpD-associated family protein, partial [Verrucomicrobiota bacterium]|nr:YdeI/OmpD-associated family protein [Verrucomicrobiota bacterium]
GEDADGMGQFGRITSINNLPDERTLIEYVQRAAELKDAGVKIVQPAKEKATSAQLAVPDYLAHALKRNAAARKTWDSFSPSHRKEYIEWLTTAKRKETRKKRLEQTLAQLTDAKPLNWKYQRK